MKMPHGRQGTGQENVTFLGVQRIPADSTSFSPQGSNSQLALKFSIVPGTQVLQQLEAAEEHYLLSDINILHVSLQLKARVMGDKEAIPIILEA